MASPNLEALLNIQSLSTVILYWLEPNLPNFVKIDQINLVLKTGNCIKERECIFHILHSCYHDTGPSTSPEASSSQRYELFVCRSVRFTCSQSQGGLGDFRFALPLGTNTQGYGAEYFLMHSISLSDNKSVHIKCEYGVKNVHSSYVVLALLSDHTVCKTVNVKKISVFPVPWTEFLGSYLSWIWTKVLLNRWFFKDNF